MSKITIPLYQIQKICKILTDWEYIMTSWLQTYRKRSFLGEDAFRLN